LPYASTLIARRLLSLAEADQRPKTPLEIVKLTYLCHGWHLTLTGKPLVSENAEAWQYGPVYPELYHAVKHYRASPVLDVPKSGVEFFGDREIDATANQVIQNVFSAYKSFNGVQLSALTHQKGTPWDQTWDGSRNKTIPDELIKKHFDELRKQRAA